MKRAVGIPVATFTLFGALFSIEVGAQTIHPTAWFADNIVDAVESDGTVVYLGGDFQRLYPPTGCAARMNPVTAEVAQPYSGIVGEVYAVAPDGSGGWYLGGYFFSVQGMPRTHLAHLDATGNVTNWNPSLNAKVRSLAVQADRVIVGGDFTTIGGQTRNRIGAVDRTTGAPLAWDPDANGAPTTILVRDTTVFVGGFFTMVGGQARNYLAAVGLAGGALTSWNPAPNNTVLGLCVDPSSSTSPIYVGGTFTSIGGQTRNRVAAIDASGNAVLGFDPDASSAGGNYVYALLVDGNTLYLGGTFTTMGGVTRNRIAAVNKSTGALANFDPDANGGVTCMAMASGTLFVGGTFSTIGGEPRAWIAGLNSVSGLATSWSGDASNGVDAIGYANGELMVGGPFQGIGAKHRSCIAQVDAATGAPTDWNPGANYWTNCFLLRPGRVYVGGRFSTIGGQSRSRIAALDPVTGAVLSWNPGANNDVLALDEADGVVYVGGSFTTLAGQTRNKIGAVLASTGAATGWNPNSNQYVSAVVVDGSRVLVGGAFTSIGGASRNKIAALDRTTGLATPFDPDAGYGVVFDLAIGPSNALYIGGDLNDVGGQTRFGLAAADLTTGSVLPWNPNVTGTVYDVDVQQGTILAAGNFTKVRGITRKHAAAIHYRTGQLLSWNPNPSQQVNQLARAGYSVFLGGEFFSIAGQPRTRFGAVSEPPLVGVEQFVEEPQVTALSVQPNPFRERVDLRFTMAHAGRVEVGIYDVVGRLVRRIQKNAAAGVQKMGWDGLDDAGRAVSAGLYFVRVRAGDVRLSSRVLRLQ